MPEWIYALEAGLTMSISAMLTGWVAGDLLGLWLTWGLPRHA